MINYCGVCGKNHDGSACPMDKSPYDEAMDVIGRLKAEIAKKDEKIYELAGDVAEKEEREEDLVRNCAKANAENDVLEAWIDDLQSGMYINCVYCGHRYGPNPSLDQSHLLTMRKALEQHIAECPKHPLSQAINRIKELENDTRELMEYAAQKEGV
jgi:DNA-directed RNA polymerase subunit RPC12/RpoP